MSKILSTQRKLQITNKMAHELHELPQIGATFNQKLLQGVQGGGFLEKSPPGKVQFLLWILSIWPRVPSVISAALASSVSRCMASL